MNNVKKLHFWAHKVNFSYSSRKYINIHNPLVVISESNEFLDIFRLTMLENYVIDIKYKNTSKSKSFFENGADSLVIIDCSSCSVDQSGLISDISNNSLNLGIIASSPDATIATAVAAIKAGAIDYLAWPFSESELESAVRRADAQLVGRSLTNEKAGVRARFGLLSPREKSVVEAIIVGKLNKVIANDLGLSIRTVEMYRASLMKKLGAKSVSDIVRAHLLQSLPY
jgi:two-component system response regulator FixJ